MTKFESILTLFVADLFINPTQTTSHGTVGWNNCHRSVFGVMGQPNLTTEYAFLVGPAEGNSLPTSRDFKPSESDSAKVSLTSLDAIYSWQQEARVLVLRTEADEAHPTAYSCRQIRLWSNTLLRLLEVRIHSRDKYLSIEACCVSKAEATSSSKSLLEREIIVLRTKDS